MIEIKNVNFSYKNNKILNNLSLTIKEGECIGIVGANGCGKSTLLSVLSGSRHSSTASIMFNNIDLNKDKKQLSQIVGYVPQDNPLIPELNAYDNLLLWFHGKRSDFSKALAKPSIQMLQLEDFLKKPVKTLSGGMKKRVSLAIGLINNPSLLILDEPSVALDLLCKEDIHRYLSAYRKEGKTILITTHEEAELDLCTTLYILKNGSLHPVDPSLRGHALISQF